ncbi:MAG TPA: alpha/beta hydrolase [Rhizobiaceae bacterium]|nr:alpha/beta hydrolase [Rhizobiaceae bacterium]
MRSRHINANGLRMHILEKGEGPVVLLAHGFPETSYSWRHQIEALAAAGFHAVAPDMRGYGETEAPAEADRYTLLDLVGDMIGILDALNASTAIIVGNDWGSTVAWQAALLRPDRFGGVVGIGVPMMSSPPVPPTQIFPQTADALLYTLYFQQPGIAEAEFEKDIAVTLRKILYSASRDAGARVEGDGTPNPFGMVTKKDGLLAPLPDRSPRWLTDSDLDVYVKAYSASGFRGGLNYYRNLDANWHLQRSLEGMTVATPALYMVGEQDVGLSIPGMRDIISAMPALVPDLMEAIFLPDCGHWAPQERPEQVSRALIQFAECVQRVSLG